MEIRCQNEILLARKNEEDAMYKRRKALNWGGDWGEE